MIIFLHGPDTFRSRQKLFALKQKFINDVDKQSLNITNLDGAKLDVQEFSKAISTPPFLAAKRMIIVQDLIAKNKGAKIQKEVVEILEGETATSRLQDTILIFWEGDLNNKSKKPSTAKPKPLLKILKAEKYAQEFKLLNPVEVKKYANQQVAEKHGKINPDALQLLTDIVGNDLWQLNSELDKLIAYANNKPITAEDVKTLTQTRLDDDIFKLTDAIGQKNKKLALQLIANQLQQGMSPTELLSKIVWQFKNLLLVKSFIDINGEGYDSNRLTYQLGVHPFVIKKTIGQIRNHTLPDLKKIYKQLLSADFKIKTSQTDPQTLFNLLIMKS